MIRASAAAHQQQPCRPRSRCIKHPLVQVRRLAADERWAGRLELRKRKDHFVFTVESAGALPPAALFARAVNVLADKADRLLQRL